MGISDGEALWAAVCDNLEKLSDITEYVEIIERATPLIDAEDQEFLSIAQICFLTGVERGDLV